MSKTALIIGATGAIGHTLTQQLLASSEFGKVITFTRREHAIKHPKLENHTIDFSKLDDYSHLIQGDYLFSCLGTTKKQAGSIAAQRVIDLDYQYKFAQMAKNNEVNHLLLVSSSGANAKSKSAYMKMKGELEQSINALNFNMLTIVQPSLLIAKRDPMRLGESIGNQLLPWLCKLPPLKQYRPIKVEQVAKKLIEYALTQTAPEQVASLSQLHD